MTDAAAFADATMKQLALVDELSVASGDAFDDTHASSLAVCARLASLAATVAVAALFAL